MNIKIENAWGMDGEIMTLYRNNEMILSVTIDGSNDPPVSLLDYLIEFDIEPGAFGIESGLDQEENFENSGTLIWIV